jgi:hypothetical protein
MTLEAITADWEQQYGLLAPPIFRPPTYTQDMEEQSPEDKAFSSRKGSLPRGNSEAEIRGS